MQVRQDLSAEWHKRCQVVCKAQERQEQEVKFSGTPRRRWLLVHEVLESTSVFPEESVRKWVLVLDFHRASEDYIRSVMRLRQLIRYDDSCFPVSSPRSIRHLALAAATGQFVAL